MKHWIDWLRQFVRLPFDRRIDCFEAWADKAEDINHRIEVGGVESAENRQKIALALAGKENVVLFDSMPAAYVPLLKDAKCRLASVQIHPWNIHSPPSLVFDGLCIRNLEIPDVAKVEIKDCRIGRLSLGAVHLNVSLDEVWVESLNLASAGIKNLTWNGGYLGSASFPEPRSVRGDVKIKGVHVSEDRSHHDIQWLRDIRKTLLEKNNLQAASVFHPIELRMSRQTDPWPLNVVSFFYGLVSDFGNSVGRAALCLFLVFLAAFLVGWIGGTSANVDGAGWVKTLGETDCETTLVRALLYALNTTLNPLNLVVSKPLIAPTQTWGALLE